MPWQIVQFTWQPYTQLCCKFLHTRCTFTPMLMIFMTISKTVQENAPKTVATMIIIGIHRDSYTTTTPKGVILLLRAKAVILQPYTVHRIRLPYLPYTILRIRLPSYTPSNIPFYAYQGSFFADICFLLRIVDFYVIFMQNIDNLAYCCSAYQGSFFATVYKNSFELNRPYTAAIYGYPYTILPYTRRIRAYRIHFPH